MRQARLAFMCREAGCHNQLNTTIGLASRHVAPSRAVTNELLIMPSRFPSQSLRREVLLLALFQFRLRNRHPIGQLSQSSAAEIHHELASTIYYYHLRAIRISAAAAARNSSSSNSTARSSCRIQGLVPRRAVTVAESRGCF